MTALMIACCKGNREMAKLLLKNGADINIKNKVDETNDIKQSIYLFCVFDTTQNGIGCLHEKQVLENNALVNFLLQQHSLIVDLPSEVS